MDDYPSAYIKHNLPLLAISGLGQGETKKHHDEKRQQLPGTAITIEQPSLPESISLTLRAEFSKADGSRFPWNGSGNPDRTGLIGFEFSFVGRHIVYPRRKAAPAPQATPDEASASPPLASNPGAHDLHSVLSPLSPTSPLFPDGLMSTAWMTKHQSEVPSVLLCFFQINADHGTASLQDNQVKSEINALKTVLSRSSFRTRLAVALVTDRPLDEDVDLENRLGMIRRATGLDAKSSFFVLSKSESPAEVSEFVLDTLTALQPISVDYYRDLTKHARRKKNRGYVPPPTGGTSRGTSQSLSSHGWNARYDFKQGVFAEFRQEMDAAERHYASAIDELFNAEGILEATPIWSARWDEGRRIADVTALRLIRCQLWRSMTSSAAETWSSYRYKTRALIDRRGKGTGTYGFATWESRWAEVMAQLVIRAEIPAFKTGIAGDEQEVDGTFVPITIMAPPEKAYASERIPPFRLLHHVGYYYRIARKFTLQRYERARAIPDEDRMPPNETPASKLADRARTYDTYMAPLPHEEMPAGGDFNEKTSLMLQALDSAAAREFESRRQYRFRAHVCLEQAKFLAAERKYEQALDILLPIWGEMSWRREGWWDLAGVVIQQLYDLAKTAGRMRLAAELRWEMSLDVFGDLSGRFGDDIGADDTTTTPLLLDSRRRLSPVSATFSFAYDEGHVGDQVPCQILLSARSSAAMSAQSLTAVKVLFNGGSSQLQISHKEGQNDSDVQTLQIEEAGHANAAKLLLSSQADLSLSHGQSRAYNFNIQLKDVGDLLVTSIQLDSKLGPYDMEYSKTLPYDFNSEHWWLAGSKGLLSRSLDRTESVVVDVLPKPPRVQLLLEQAQSQYFTGEALSLELAVVNEESESVQGTLRFEVPDDVLEATELHWKDDQDGQGHELSLSRAVNVLETKQKQAYKLFFKAPSEPTSLPITVTIDYTINNDPTPVTKTTTFNFKLIHPFATDFDLVPRLDEEKWPCFFHLPSTPGPLTSSIAIRQKWSLSAQLSSNVTSVVHIKDISLKLQQTSANIICDIPTASFLTTDLTPASKSSFDLHLHTRRPSTEDRRPSSLSLTLNIAWSRTPDSPSVITALTIPPLTIPPAEPRVLCTAGPASSSTDNTAGATTSPLQNTREVRYTIENPSMHFLAFSAAMEANDAFAFSGPKVRGVALTPLSRAEIKYRIMLLGTTDGVVSGTASHGKKGKWVYPVLRVTDSYFNKTLRVMEAGEGVKGDERTSVEGGGKGAVGVWVPVP